MADKADSSKKVKGVRRIPGFGRVASETAFREMETNLRDDLELYQEATDKLVRRAMEDMSWTDINNKSDVGLSDMPHRRRKQVVRRAVRFWLEDPVIGNAIDLRTQYVFGKGAPKPRFENRKAQEVIDKFWSNPDNKLVLTSFEAQEMKSAELQTQGNVYLTLFVNEEAGEVVLSDLLFAEVDDIICHPENRKKHLFYKRVVTPVMYDFASGEYVTDSTADPKVYYHPHWENWPLPEDDEYASQIHIPAGKLGEGVVYHIRINSLSDGKFGNPKVLRALDWARAYNQFMRARVALMEAAAWVAWRRKMKGDPTQIRKQASDFVTSRFAAAGMDQSTDDTGAAPPPARFAAMITENENTSLEFMKTDTGSANAKNDGQMLKAQSASGMQLPLHYFGDSEGANLASSTAMELPVLKSMEADQERWEGIFRSITDKVIEVAIKGGILPKPKSGKFSDIKEGEEIKGTARDNGYDDHFIEAMLDKYGDGILVDDTVKEAGTGAATPEISTGNDITMDGLTGDDIYAYHFALPSILQRQLAETINAVVNMLKALDPNGTNDDLARWAFDYCLQTFQVSNAPEIMERVMPKGKSLDRSKPEPSFGGGTAVPERGPGRIIDNKKQRQSAASTTGGPRRAWTAQDYANSGKSVGLSKEAATDTPFLDDIKSEFEEAFNAIHAELTDDLLASVIGGDSGQPSS